MKTWIHYDGKNQDNYDIAKDIFIFIACFWFCFYLNFVFSVTIYYVTLCIANGSACVKNNKQYKYSINTGAYEDVLNIMKPGSIHWGRNSPGEGGGGQFTKGEFGQGEFAQVGPSGGNWPGEFDRGEFTRAGGGNWPGENFWDTISGVASSSKCSEFNFISLFIFLSKHKSLY